MNNRQNQTVNIISLCTSQNMDNFQPAQTSVPDWVMTYCRQLADVYYGRKLNRMYVHMLQSFIAYAPYKAEPPFPWRMAKIHGSTGRKPRKGADLSWVPMNMVLPEELAKQIRLVIDIENVNAPDDAKILSLRTFLYTAVCWWCSAVYPYKGSGMLEE